MASFKIEGGYKLSGEIVPQGAKNEALQVICATLLTTEKVIIHNIPDITDVHLLIYLIEKIGVTVEKLYNGTYTFQAKNLSKEYLNTSDFAKKNISLRGSIMLAGPLIARLGYTILPKIGGDKIGRRRLDAHLIGIQKLGTKIVYNKNHDSYELRSNGLKGTYIIQEEASVTGTANILMASTLTKGITTIYNAACEPYLQQLTKMLIAMGANVSGLASNLLTIKGVNQLHGCEHTLLPDMVEVGSFIGMAAITRSELRIKNVSYNNLGLIPNFFQKLGIIIYKERDDIIIPSQKSYTINTFIDGSILTISDAPWPGLTPDLLSILLVLATQAKGSVLIHQKMFESRLFFVDRLTEMGAQIILCDPHRAVVIGSNGKRLKPTTMTSPDIRAGVAMLIATMNANGISKIHNIDQIDRGYQYIDKRLNSIGARITRYDL